MPTPTKPLADVTQLRAPTTTKGGMGVPAPPAPSTRPGKGSTQVTPCASEPARGTQVRPLTVTEPGKDASHVMSAFLQEGGCGCHPGCCCHDHGEPGERPFGPPPLPVTEKARDARKEVREQLVATVTALVRQLNAAHLAGSITPTDLEMLHALQGWYSQLQAEQDAAKRKR